MDIVFLSLNDVIGLKSTSHSAPEILPYSIRFCHICAISSTFRELASVEDQRLHVPNVSTHDREGKICLELST